MESKLDFKYFFPEVYQAVAGSDYCIYAYMNDGSVRMYNAKPLVEKGGIFEPLKNEAVFKGKLTVINGTIAWDLLGNRSETDCIDVDPFEVFNSPVVDDFPEEI